MLTQWDRTQRWTLSRLGVVGMAALVVCAGTAAGVTTPVASAPGGDVQNGGTDSASRGRVMVIQTGKGAGLQLEVQNPSAYMSPARVAAGFPEQIRSSAPVYTVFGEVILIVESREAAKRAVESLRGEFPWMTSSMLIESESLAGVFTIGTRSVENAARIAELLSGSGLVENVMVNYEQPKRSRGGGSDPALFRQWHIDNGVTPANDHRIQEVHDTGVTGAGVVVGVLEAFSGNFTSPYDPDNLDVPGYDFSDVVHPDLFPNFALNLSQITDPFQVNVSHETSVAGLIGAAANSSFGRGVAFNAQLASLRNGSNLQTAEGWAHEANQIDLTNNSWGPVNDFFPLPSDGLLIVAEDDFEVAIPGVGISQLSPVEEIALNQNNTTNRGRKGRPNIMAAGNASSFQGFERFLLGNATNLPEYGLLDVVIDMGVLVGFDATGTETEDWRYSGMIGDRTEYWEANAHPANLVIAAVGEDNQRAGYSTTGTAILAAAYSEGGTLAQDFTFPFGYGFSPVGRAMTTTEQLTLPLDASCPLSIRVPGLTCSFNGTSAAAPIATGVFALMLEANPDLTIRDIEHIIQRTAIPLNFNPVGSYWTTAFGFGVPDPDGGGLLFWQANSGDVLHSDEYGFGLIDAEAAVDMARTWPGAPRLVVLDTGVIESQVEVPDATYEELGNIGSEDEPIILFEMEEGPVVSAGRELPNGSIIGSMACVRENLSVEKVFVTVTISGRGSGDLFLVLESPNGSVSPLAIPRNDSGFFVAGEEFAYFDYTFKTYKHWGELSGGQWNLYLQDYGPNAATPEGELPDDGGTPMDPSDDEPGEDHITVYGPLGVPSGEFFELDEKALVSFRLEIHGTETGIAPTLACPPVLTTCPGDLNGNGIVTFEDLAIFLSWYNVGDPLADINGDGQVTFDDIQAFLSIWSPGFCNAGALGRPDPNVPSDRPIIRPI